MINTGQGCSGLPTTVTSVTSANGNATVATTTTTPVITVVAAPKLATARAINGVNFDGTVAITVAIPNVQTAGTGGVTANTFVAIDTSAPSKFVTAGTGSCGAGVALATAASGATFQLSDSVGIVQVTADSGGMTAGHLIVGSTVTPGLAMDSGQTLSSNIANGLTVCGTAEATVAGGALVNELPHGRGSRGAKIDLINAVSMQGLSTGLVKNTTATGVPSIAVAGTDYQAPISLTTTGTSGAATLSGGVLNIPQYSGGGGGSPGGSTTQIQYNSSGAFAGSANFTWDNTNGRLLIGAPTSTAAITLVAGTTAPSGINFGDSGSNLYRSAANSIKTDGNFLAVGNVTAVGSYTSNGGNFTALSGSMIARHFVGNGTVPTVAAGAGAGTSPTVAVVSDTDFSGYITATTGTSPTASAAIATVTFGNAYTSAVKCFVTPSSTATQALALAAQAQVLRANSTTALFVLSSGPTALAASTAYEWEYTCTQ